MLLADQPASEGAVGMLSSIQEKMEGLTQQTPKALLRLRIFEIGLPLILCAVSLWLLKFYPLTDKRAYEVKGLLEDRNKQRKEEE